MVSSSPSASPLSAAKVKEEDLRAFLRKHHGQHGVLPPYRELREVWGFQAGYTRLVRIRRSVEVELSIPPARQRRDSEYGSSPNIVVAEMADLVDELDDLAKSMVTARSGSAAQDDGMASLRLQRIETALGNLDTESLSRRIDGLARGQKAILDLLRAKPIPSAVAQPPVPIVVEAQVVDPQPDLQEHPAMKAIQRIEDSIEDLTARMGQLAQLVAAADKHSAQRHADLAGANADVVERVEAIQEELAGAGDVQAIAGAVAAAVAPGQGKALERLARALGRRVDKLADRQAEASRQASREAALLRRRLQAASGLSPRPDPREIAAARVAAREAQRRQLDALVRSRLGPSGSVIPVRGTARVRAPLPERPTRAATRSSAVGRVQKRGSRPTSGGRSSS